MQFNTIYINNINKEIDQSIVDAISTYSKFNISETSGSIPTVDVELQSLGINNPYIILNGPCEWFESWSDSRINFDANTEVYFFLYEVLSVWHNHSRYNCPEGVIDKDCSINEFDMIKAWCDKHNCKFKIFTNEYQMKDALRKTQYANWAICPLDTFSLGYCHLNKKTTGWSPTEFKYKVACFTYRWDQHRHHAVSFLYNTFGNDAIITHYHETSDVAYKYSFKKSKHWQTLVNGRNALVNVVPLSVEKGPIKAVNMREYINPAIDQINNIGENTSDNIEDYYFNSFVTLACETNYEYPWGQISEKVLDPMKQGSAILLLAGPGSLQLLKHWGLKTFNNFWNEDYDNEIDPIKRMDKVFDILTDIKKQSKKELQQIKKHMQPILVHNRNHIRTGAIRKEITKVLT